MLKRIRLTNFKSFADAEVELAPLTLLVGANASGKSNLLEAIQILQGLALGLTLDEVLEGRRRGGITIWSGVRGGAREITYAGRPAFTIETDWHVLDPITTFAGGVPVPRGEASFAHRIRCAANGGVTLEEESVQQVGLADPLFESVGRENGRLLVRVLPSDSEKPPLVLKLSASKSLLHGISLRDDDRLSTEVHPAVVEGAHWLVQAMSEAETLNFQPSAMRQVGRKKKPLGGDGENISGLLADICEDASSKQVIVDWLAELCAPELVDIDFVENSDLGVMLQFVEKGGRRISARNLSDGTLRFLGLLVALRGAEPGSTYLLEEIDAGLHPTRLRLLVDFLGQVTRDRGIQVIATTHSPALLQWLDAEALRSVIAFGRVPDAEGTILRRLGDLPHFEEVVKQDHAGDLFSTGWMEMAL